MKKAVIVINGAGGVGKDTLCDLAAKHFKVYKKALLAKLNQEQKDGYKMQKNKLQI